MSQGAQACHGADQEVLREWVESDERTIAEAMGRMIPQGTMIGNGMGSDLLVSTFMRRAGVKGHEHGESADHLQVDLLGATGGQEILTDGSTVRIQDETERATVRQYALLSMCEESTSKREWFCALDVDSEDRGQLWDDGMVERIVEKWKILCRGCLWKWDARKTSVGAVWLP